MPAAPVEAVPVGLDHQSPIPPQEVDDEAANPRIHLGRGQTVAAAEPKEEMLQLAAGGISRRLARHEPQDLRLAERPPNLFGCGKAAQIGDRASRRGHPDAVATCRNRLSQREGAVEPDPSARSPPARAWNGDVDDPAVGWQEVPELGSAAMAKRCAVAASQHRREPRPLVAQARMAHCVDRTVYPMESSRPDPARDTVLATPALAAGPRSRLRAGEPRSRRSQRPGWRVSRPYHE